MSRLLIVEDEKNLAKGMKFNFELEGYEVDVVGDGAQALARLTPESPATPATKYDLVVLDVMMPGIDGFEVADRMRKAGNFVPILMLTAKSLPADVVHGLEAGADDYLPKPFDLPVLLARVKGLLRRRDWARGDQTELERARIGAAEVDFRNFQIQSGARDLPPDAAGSDAAEAPRAERGARRLQGRDPGEGLECQPRHRRRGRWTTSSSACAATSSPTPGIQSIS